MYDRRFTCISSAGKEIVFLDDLKNNRDFWDKYEGKIDDISNEINNTYLKANGVSEGVKSYGKMVDLLLTYYSLYPYKN